MNPSQHILCLLQSFYDPSAILRRRQTSFVISNFNNMKKSIILGAMIVFLSLTANAQNKTTSANTPNKTATASAQNKAIMDSLIHEVQGLRKELHEADSINKLLLDGIYRNIDKPRFKMYQTDNIYNLLKLDTRRGKVWQVQYRMGDTKSQVVSLSIFGIVSEDDGWDGRFELYPTKNMYTFIMLDTGTGDTYQVQWSTKGYDYQFVEPLK